MKKIFSTEGSLLGRALHPALLAAAEGSWGWLLGVGGPVRFGGRRRWGNEQRYDGDSPLVLSRRGNLVRLERYFFSESERAGEQTVGQSERESLEQP